MKNGVVQRPSRTFRRVSFGPFVGACASMLGFACGGANDQPPAGADAARKPSMTTTQDDAGSPDAIATFDGSAFDPGMDANPFYPPGDGGTSNPLPDSGARDATVDASPNPITDASAPRVDGGYPVGWLFTRGNKIYVSDGTAAGKPWMGRGVNIDDIFFCGFNSTLSMISPDATLKTMIGGVMSAWKPTFIRISLSMASNAKVTSWLTNPPQYKTPMTNVINAIGAYPNVHVLVTLRSDSSMILQDTTHGDPEATGLPSDRTTTPNAALYPTGTDATYAALVDTFANASFVMFGLTNEPGGNLRSDATIGAAMKHAVDVIRAEEDRLGVPHHIVSVQGNGWTSNIAHYAATPAPITADNVVYEVHGYPPSVNSYTYANIPVIIGEYGSLTSATSAAFYADIESKQIPNLAWDFDPYSNCAPDMVTVTHSATNLTATPWGTIVQSYLLAH